MQQFYTPAELRAGLFYQAENGNRYHLVSPLPRGKAVVVREEEGADFEIITLEGFFVKPDNKKQRVQAWWSAKFGKQLSDATYLELVVLFNGEELVNKMEEVFEDFEEADDNNGWE